MFYQMNELCKAENGESVYVGFPPMLVGWRLFCVVYQMLGRVVAGQLGSSKRTMDLKAGTNAFGL
jgi:hypothetical protein